MVSIVAPIHGRRARRQLTGLRADTDVQSLPPTALFWMPLDEATTDAGGNTVYDARDVVSGRVYAGLAPAAGGGVAYVPASAAPDFRFSTARDMTRIIGLYGQIAGKLGSSGAILSLPRLTMTLDGASTVDVTNVSYAGPAVIVPAASLVLVPMPQLVNLAIGDWFMLILKVAPGPYVQVATHDAVNGTVVGAPVALDGDPQLLGAEMTSAVSGCGFTPGFGSRNLFVIECLEDPEDIGPAAQEMYEAITNGPWIDTPGAARMPARWMGLV